MKTQILANLEILEKNQKQPRRTKIGCHCGLVSAKNETFIGKSHNLFGKAHLGRNRPVTIHKYAFRDEIE